MYIFLEILVSRYPASKGIGAQLCSLPEVTLIVSEACPILLYAKLLDLYGHEICLQRHSTMRTMSQSSRHMGDENRRFRMWDVFGERGRYMEMRWRYSN